MELNWSTFVLEIINFLVLVWILKRFFYRPVLNVIARRRAGIEKTLDEARTLHEDAEALQTRYRNRLADWEQERQQAREQLAGEIEKRRAQELATLRAGLARETEKARVAEARRQADLRHNIEEQALLQAARFASRLLGEAATPELQARLLDLVMEELPKLPDERLAALRNSGSRAPDTVVVASAWPLSQSQREALQRVLASVIGNSQPPRFEQDSDLLAGVRINIGAWVLGANLRDELNGFEQLAHAGKQS